jgi:foldase protein PrsA
MTGERNQRDEGVTNAMSRFFTRYQKPFIWIVVAAFLIGGGGLLSLNRGGVFGPPAGDDPDVQYVAEVNEVGISAEMAEEATSTLLNYYRTYYEQAGMSIADLVSGASGALFLLGLRDQGLSVTIREILYEQAAAQRGIRISKSEIDAAFAEQYEEILLSNDLTEGELESILAQQGQTLEGFRASIREDVQTQLRNARLREAVVGSIQPTEDQLRSYMEANISRYDSPERVRASHILVSDESTAMDLREQLDAGVEFSTLAETYSECPSASSGGDLDWFERGAMAPEFEEVAFSLETGVVSEPVLTEFGWHIIKVTDREAAFVPRFSEIREQLETDYIEEKEEEQFASWYSDFYQEAEIVIHDPLLRAYRLQQEDLELGIAEYERLLAAGEVGDPYFEYYIGRAYEQRSTQASADRAALEAAEEPTEEDLARLDELSALISSYETLALEHYLNVLTESGVEADEDFVNRVLLLDPSSTDAQLILGELYVRQGDVVSAERQFSEIIRQSPDYVRAYISSGDLALRQGANMQAVSRFEAARELWPEDTTIMIRLITAYLRVGFLDEAEAELERMAAIDPANVKMRFAEGELAHARLEEAIKERDALLEIEESQRTEEQRARLVSLPEEIEEYISTAIDRYKKGLQVSGTLDVMLKLGQVYLLAGRLDEARNEFMRVISRSPYRVDAYVGMAEVLIRQDDISGALEQLESAYARSLDHSQKEAISRRILDLDPESTESRLRLARALGKQYKWTAATAEYGAILNAEPDSIEAYLGIAEAYRARNDHVTAAEYLRRGLEFADLDSQREELYQALIVTAQGMVGESQPLPPEGLDARIDLAKLYLSQDRFSSALTELELVQSVDPSYRLDEVNALIMEAGGTVVMPVDTSEDDDAPGEDSSNSQSE